MALDAVQEDERITHAADSAAAILAAELKRLRERADLAIRALSQRLGIATGQISEFERAIRLPAPDAIESYERYFELETGALMVLRQRAYAESLENPLVGVTEARLGTEAPCPYKGLQVFEPEDADLFFGRDEQVETTLAALARSRFIAIVGASGSGKSSFARAGLVPKLKGDVALLTPGDRPLENLCAALGLDVASLRADPEAIALDGPVTVLVDQFEELFTLCPVEAERQAFVAALLSAWRDPVSSVAVVLTLRSDFYGEVTAFSEELSAAVSTHQTVIRALSGEGLHKAIELPAGKAGLALQQGLADTIVSELEGAPGALPLLSHAMFETWGKRSRRLLTIGGYRATGGRAHGDRHQCGQRVRAAVERAQGDRAGDLPEPGRRGGGR